MRETDEPSTEPEVWGTCEDLLLACAVIRHGPHRWDSVAAEIRSRSPYARRLTAEHCLLRFRLLTLRFSDGGEGTDGKDRPDSKTTVEIPWLDELRKLRVDELRRQLHRHDASIGSLELQVKKLKEERKRSTSDGVNGSGTKTGSESDLKEKNDSNSTEPKVGDRVGEEAHRGFIGSGTGSVNESVAESKEEGTSRRRELSAVGKTADVESQPLIDFLEMIRKSKDGLVLNLRVEIQGSERYRSLIRCHVDFDMVRNRIGRNGYSKSEFYRDLLLMCNNALVFYPNNSPESISAVHLRDMINKGIAANLRTAARTSPRLTQEPTLPPSPPLQPKSDPDPRDKPAPLPPLVACRKRSSVTGKPAKPAMKVEKEEKQGTEEEVKDGKGQAVVDKKSMKQRSMRSDKTRATAKNSNVNPVSTPKPDPMEEEPKPKKREAMKLLGRMNAGLNPSSKGKANVEVPKSSLSNLVKGRGEQQKKKQKEESNKLGDAKNAGRPVKRMVGTTKRAREEKTPSLPRKRGRR